MCSRTRSTLSGNVAFGQSRAGSRMNASTPGVEEAAAQDYYELLQVSTTAEIETIHRVYRLLAQRFHPDNRETGSASRFRLISEAYNVLCNPEARARYDIAHQQQRQDRWRLVS